jgi:hypothetical protein
MKFDNRSAVRRRWWPFAAGFLVAALGARAADEPARPRPAAERAGTDSARAQPTAEQFAPPNQPDISADDARTVDAPPPGASGARPAFDRG